MKIKANKQTNYCSNIKDRNKHVMSIMLQNELNKLCHKTGTECYRDDIQRKSKYVMLLSDLNMSNEFR